MKGNKIAKLKECTLAIENINARLAESKSIGEKLKELNKETEEFTERLLVIKMKLKIIKGN